MKKAHQAISWVVEQNNPDSFACATPDTKGRICELVCTAIKKKRRIFRYNGVGIPQDVIRKLGKLYPGFVIQTQDAPSPMNAVVGFAQTPDQYAAIWHCPTVLYLTEQKPANSAAVVKYDGEPTLWIIPAQHVPQRGFQVKTRNCVDDTVIQNNVIHALSLGLKCLPVVAAHGERVVMIGGGPSIVNYLDEFRVFADAPGHRLACVKSSHNLVLDMGITPWACMLLDPRDHVKDFIEDPAPGVKYIVSSTCAPTTFERLLSRGAEVWLYHALVGASEDSLVRLNFQVAMRERQKFAQWCQQHNIPMPQAPEFEMGEQMVAGGTTAAARGISTLHMLGFRHFILRGFDSCYYEQKDMKEKKKDGSARYQQVNLGGKGFTTDAELVAQVQDFQHLVNGSMPDCTFEIHGDGMIPQVFKGWKRPKQLAEVFPAT